MRQRLNILFLALALPLTISAQPSDGIVAMDHAISTFLQSSELMTLDTHWSHKQQQWTFKYVTSGDGPKEPAALTALLDSFSQLVPQAASSYFHSSYDGDKPFATLVYKRKDNYYSGIVGTYDVKDNYNLRVLNFQDADGLTSYGMMWCAVDFTDCNGQAFHTIDGVLFKLYGGIWQMQPFRQDNPWEPKDQTARRPISQGDRALYETLLSQIQYLNGLYRQNQQSGNEQNCDAIAYMTKNLLEGYEGRLNTRQYTEILRVTPALGESEAGTERSRMLHKAVAKLHRSVSSAIPLNVEYTGKNKGPFVKNDDLRLLPLSYRRYKLDEVTASNTVEVSLTGPATEEDLPIKIQPVCPKEAAYDAETGHQQFSLTADFAKDQLLEVSDGKGHRMLLFADSIPTTINLARMTLTGSPLNERFAECQRRLDALKPELHKYTSEFGFNHDFEVMDTEGFNRLSADAHQLQMQLIEENMDNLIPVWYLADNYTTMTLDELSQYLKKDRPYADHIALQPVWQWYKGLQKRQPGTKFHDAECIDTLGVCHRLSDYIGRGDYVVLNFWSTRDNLTRSSCKTMKQIAKEHEGRNLRVIGFALDSDKESWRRYVEARNLTYEHLSAPKDKCQTYEQWTAAAKQAYGIQALPESIVFDPKGRIVAIGLLGNTLKEMIRTLPLK